VWLLVVIFLPVIGFILYFLIGTKQKRKYIPPEVSQADNICPLPAPPVTNILISSCLFHDLLGPESIKLRPEPVDPGENVCLGRYENNGPVPEDG